MGPPGTTTLRVENHVVDPEHLDALSMTVDGVTIPLSTLPPAGRAATKVTRLELGAGRHALSARIKGHTGEAGVIVVDTQQGFHLGKAPAVITVVLRSGKDVGGPSIEPIAIRVTLEGGQLDPEMDAAPPVDRTARCAPLLPVPKALCRAAAELDTATRSKNVVATLCVRDKLDAMRRLAELREPGATDGVSLAEAQIATLSRQIERCGGGAVAMAAPEGVSVERPTPSAPR